ncbi:MAG TPA: hypothetical protein VLE27_16505, partial [Thermoanaerobaculia bacterium]|nr:hypothetical protein [Thermoanaerobaculia bacterium]
MKRTSWMGLFLLALAVVAAPAAASTFIALDQQELLAQSDAVVEGRVLKVSSFWSASGRMIVTEVMVQVEEKILGNAPGVVVLRTAGGTVGGYTVEAHGFPKFEVGERAVLFLQNSANVAEVTGYRQGQYRIVREKSGVEMAVPALGPNVRLLHRDGTPAAAPKAVRLDQLKAQLRAEAVRDRGRHLEN